MTGMELAVAKTVSLPNLAEAKSEVIRLVSIGDDGALHDAHAKAEAAALYARRAGHADAEARFAQLRILTEAALGVLSFGNPAIIPSAHDRKHWRGLAAAFERGRLDECMNTGYSARDVCEQVRNRGLNYVSLKYVQRHSKSPPILTPWATEQSYLSIGVPWSDARDRIPVELWTKVPPCREYLAELRRRRKEASRIAKERAYHASKYRSKKDQEHRAWLAKQRGGTLAEVYSFVRRALDALENDRDLDPATRKRIFAGLYDAEDAIGDALRGNSGRILADDGTGS